MLSTSAFKLDWSQNLLFGKELIWTRLKYFHTSKRLSTHLLYNEILTLSSMYTHFNTLKRTAFGKHCGKR